MAKAARAVVLVRGAGRRPSFAAGEVIGSGGRWWFRGKSYRLEEPASPGPPSRQ